MQSFDFVSVGKILFGRGKAAQLGAVARELGAIALVIHNGDDPGSGGAVDRCAESLWKAGMHVAFHRQRGEPTVHDVDAGVMAARKAAADVIVAVGGGSAIDAAKAVAGLLTNGGVALDYMEVIGKGLKITKPAMPWIAVPTTAGTGAEVTKNAVIGSPERNFKASIRSEHLLARVVVVDPEMGVRTPAAVTAASGMDALCQCIEGYTSNGANAMTDAWAREGAWSAATSLAPAFEDGSDVDTREGMALAALLSGVTLTNAGLGAVHGFAAPLGANFTVPHGVICARLLPAVVAANVAGARSTSASHPLLEKYQLLGTIMFGSRARDPEVLVAQLQSLTETLHIPRLGHFGLREEHIADMVALAKKASSMRYNPVVLADDVLANILRSAL